MIPTDVKRPRNVDWKRAAAILYGDWGTSKAYVIGLAFAVAGYSSFWLIAAMCVLTALVGLNYMVICRLYPDGGGVYASVRHRSEVISIVGAFLLIADYLVTAAISALSAFQYLGVPHPEKFAATSILPAPKGYAITCCVTWAKFSVATRLVPRLVTHSL